MTWEIAQRWVASLSFGNKLLGIWRSQLGPGPFSIFFLDERGQTIEAWPNKTGSMFGKVYQQHPKTANIC